MLGAILAGGLSKRYGRNKARELFQGTPLLQRQVQILGRLFEEVVVVTNKVEDYLDIDALVVRDVVPRCGPLGGIYTALLFAGSQSVFVTACDMPFLSADLIKHMRDYGASGYDIVIPRYGGYLEPLHAIYSPRCLPPIKNLLRQGRYRVKEFFPRVKMLVIEAEEIRRFDPEGLVFLNINTPEDMEAAKAAVAAGRIQEQPWATADENGHD